MRQTGSRTVNSNDLKKCLIINAYAFLKKVFKNFTQKTRNPQEQKQTFSCYFVHKFYTGPTMI